MERRRPPHLQGLLTTRRGDTTGARRILDRLVEVGGDAAGLGRARIHGLLGKPEAARRALGAPGAAEFEASSPSVWVFPELGDVLGAATSTCEGGR